MVFHNEILNLPREVQCFWFEICSEDIEIAKEITYEYEESVILNLALLKKILLSADNKNLNHKIARILHNFIGSLALLGFEKESIEIQKLEVKCIRNELIFDKEMFNLVYETLHNVVILLKKI